MSVSVVGEAIRRVAKEARKDRLNRIATDDATSKSREHAAYKPGSGKGVLAALSAAGMRLSPTQRAAIQLVIRAHPEMASNPFTANTAVERLITHGIEFTDAQLELVSDECSVSGFRRIQSGFEDRRTTASNPAHRPRTTATAIIPAQGGGFFAWLRRTWVALSS